MDYLPYQLVLEILSRIKKTIDKNSVSLSCKRLHELDNEQRKSPWVGCGLHPANEALTSLCNRFRNLVRVEISYSGWMSKLGKQMDDEGLFILSNNCPSLVDLTLSYCTFITDAGLSNLASCSMLSALKLHFTPRIAGCGILSLVVGCKKFSVLHLSRCLNVSHEGLQLVDQFSRLCSLRLSKCLGVTVDGLKPLVGSYKLEFCLFKIVLKFLKEVFDEQRKWYILQAKLIMDVLNFRKIIHQLTNVWRVMICYPVVYKYASSSF